MTDYKVFCKIRFNDTSLNIMINSKKEYGIDIFDLSVVMMFHSRNYLYNYYYLNAHKVKSRPPVELFEGKYIDIKGINNILNRSIKPYARELLEIIMEKTKTVAYFIMPKRVEETYCNDIIEYICAKYGEDYNFIRQYKVDTFYIDLCIHKKSEDKYYLIEIDENGHLDRDIESEAKREKHILDKTGEKLIRINPATLTPVKTMILIDSILKS